jgi:hypothetical protein
VNAHAQGAWLLRIARFLVSINVPDDIIGQAINTITSALGHLGKAFSLGLILKGVAREVDAGTVDIGFDDYIDAANAVEGYFNVFVFEAVTHCGHVFAVGFVFFVAWCQLVLWAIVAKGYAPSASTTFFSSLEASLIASGDSCQEL